MTVIKTTTPIARKDYTCDLCHQQIPHGTRYKCVILRADGRLVTQHVHQTCPATVLEASSSGVVSNPRQTAPLFIQGGGILQKRFFANKYTQTFRHASISLPVRRTY